MMKDDEEFSARIGTVLKGKWTLERLLGVGGMAAVFVGVHRIGRRDAIKILHPEVARNKELRKRFEQEAHAVNRFSHPGAVEIRDVDVTDDGAPFLVMELLDGEPLGAELARGQPMAEGDLVRIGAAVLDVLGAAHATGIIHRDVKPDNVFMLRDGRIKVLDFGIARVRGGPAANSLHTKTGSSLGTLSYMPPEQVRGLEIDPRADIFAVGATLFRLRSTKRIHDAKLEAELLVKMATQPAPSLGTAAPGTSRGFVAVVDRALAFDRERRYPDAKTMADDLRAVGAGLEPPFAMRGGAPAAAVVPMGLAGPASLLGAVAAAGVGAGAVDAGAATVAPGQLRAADVEHTRAPGMGAPAPQPSSHVPAAPRSAPIAVADTVLGLTPTPAPVSAAPGSAPSVGRTPGSSSRVVVHANSLALGATSQAGVAQTMMAAAAPAARLAPDRTSATRAPSAAPQAGVLVAIGAIALLLLVAGVAVGLHVSGGGERTYVLGAGAEPIARAVRAAASAAAPSSLDPGRFSGAKKPKKGRGRGDD